MHRAPYYGKSSWRGGILQMASVPNRLASITDSLNRILVPSPPFLIPLVPQPKHYYYGYSV